MRNEAAIMNYLCRFTAARQVCMSIGRNSLHGSAIFRKTSGRKPRRRPKTWPVFDFWQHLSPIRSRSAAKWLKCVYPECCERKLACSHFCNICSLEIKIKFCMSPNAAAQILARPPDRQLILLRSSKGKDSQDLDRFLGRTHPSWPIN